MRSILPGSHLTLTFAPATTVRVRELFVEADNPLELCFEVIRTGGEALLLGTLLISALPLSPRGDGSRSLYLSALMSQAGISVRIRNLSDRLQAFALKLRFEENGKQIEVDLTDAKSLT